MLSRRNIRIKVMQLLYAKSRDPKLTLENILKQYRENVSSSYELYLLSLLQFTKVAQYSLHDASKRTAKLLPSDEDKQFKAQLAHNELIQSIIKNEDLYKMYRRFYLEAKLDKDSTRIIYSEFLKTDVYKSYIKKSEPSFDDNKQILLELYKHCINNELFTDKLEDHYPNWIDDKSLVIGTIKKTLKVLPATDNFFEQYLPSDEAVKDFGEEMLRRVYQDDEDYLEIIEPTLKNWDADRVAIIDMILLKMSVCELLHFPTIPTKVTLNEFVEISKSYSTDKSKDFINGILDRLMKKLDKDGKIIKQGRGLQE